MHGSSAEQMFEHLESLRARARSLLEGEAAPASPIDCEQALVDCEQALVEGVDLRLPRLRRLCGLDELSLRALVALVAVDSDPAMRTFVRSLQRDAGRPWIELGLLAELLDLPPRRFPELAGCFAAEAPLVRHALVVSDDEEVPRIARKVKAAARVVDYLFGEDRLPEGFRLIAEPRPVLDESVLPEEARQQLLQRSRRALDEGTPLVVELSGPSGVGKRYLAEGLAEALGRPILIVDFEGPEDLAARLAAARREARLAEAVLCLAHWQRGYHAAQPARSHEEPGPAPIRRLPPLVERFLSAEEGLLLLTGDEPESLLDRLPKPVFHVAVPFPTPSQRAELLAGELGRRGLSLAPDCDGYGIARRFALDPRRIAAATHLCAQAAEGAELRGNELSDACRAQLRHDLTSLAERVTTSYSWEDLVIPVDVYHGLCEMVAHMRHGRRVFDEWGLGQRHGLSQGLSALFAGPPGTGKTMCASVMARELDMELFRIDLSRVVSKWIGETEKNLSRLFDEAQRSNAIILFDEADSLFAKRTAVKSSVDRYANLEVNYLLQRMEAFSGVTILTTNFEDTIDTAFKRRLTFRLRFERPDAVARTSLWQKVFPPACTLGADFDAAELGSKFDLSGGSIRNAAVRAAFLAAEANRVPGQDDCERAAEREAQEMGALAHSAPRRRDEERPSMMIEPPPLPRAASAGSSPRLVPITHPRYR